METLEGGSGDDSFEITGNLRLNLMGGAGNDNFIFLGNAGLNGHIDGGTGSDTLGFSGSSTARSIRLIGAGADGFSGQQASITNGFANIDSLMGSTAANDTLTGMDEDSVYTLGDDDNNILLVSGFSLDFSGYEFLVGGSGNDTFTITGNGSINGGIDGGAGIDTLDYSGYDKGDGSGVIVSLQNGAATAIAGGRNGGIQRIENLTGSLFDDSLTGDNNANIIRGGAGNDQLYGLGGNDILIGGTGNDLLDGGAGIDTVDYSDNTAAGVEVSLMEGTAVSSDSGADTLASIENVIGSDFDDVICGDDNANQLEGGAGNDRIYGLGGNDILSGGLGDDLLDGGSGDDIYVFADNWGSDTVMDEAGLDSFDFTAIAADLVFAFSRDELLITAGSNSTFNEGLQVEKLLAGSGDDTLILAEGASWQGSWDAGDGGNSLDLSGRSGDHLIVITALNTGYIEGLFSFNGVEHITGGSGSDTFRFHDGTSISGSIDGGGGSDWLDFSAYTSGIVVNLATGEMTVSGLTAAVTGIENVNGGQGDDILTGDDGDNILCGNGGADYLDGGKGNDTFVFKSGWGTGDVIGDSEGFDTVTFAGLLAALTIELTEQGWTVTDGSNYLVHLGHTIENLISGDGHDTFIISGAARGNLYGAGGNDSFRFTANGSLDGSIDGGAGQNTLDYSAYTAGGVQVNLGTNTAMALSGTFSAITAFIGSPAMDTLAGPDADTEYMISGTNAIVVNSLNFSGFENLVGGNGNDTFHMGTSGALGGTITGGDGQDTLSYENYLRAVSFTITGADATGFAGEADSLAAGFSGINTLKGSSHSDSFSGMDSASTFTIGSSSSYTVGLYTLSLVGLESLSGGSGTDIFIINGTVNCSLAGGAGDDSFIFLDGAVLGGSLDGGSGSDTLDFANYLTGQDVVLTATGIIDGFNGTCALVAAGFSNIDSLRGSQGGDTLTGINSHSVFDLGAGTYTSGNTLNFSGFEVLQGGTANDTFIIVAADFGGELNGGAGDDIFRFADGAMLAGIISGGAGIDLLDFSAYTTGVVVDLATGVMTANGLTAQVKGIENITGGRGDDILSGDDGDNVLTGGPGNDVLRGGGGNDTYVFHDAWGNDSISENIDGGTDTVDFSTVNTELSFIFSSTGILVSDPATGGTVNCGLEIENFLGGTSNDTFIFKGEIVIKGRIDGGSGQDTLDFSEYARGINIVLSGFGTKDGFQAVEASVQGGIDNIDKLIATAQVDSLTGLDQDAVWTLDEAGYEYTSGSRSLSLAAIEDLIGGANQDTFRFADGTGHKGSIQGGSGIDHLDLSGFTVAVLVNLADGTAQTLSGSIVSGAIAGVENVTGGSGNDELIGDEKDNHLAGGAGDDIIYGGAGDDVLDGGAGDDKIYGEAGNDTITGGSGDDLLSGGPGNNTYSFTEDWGTDTIIGENEEDNGRSVYPGGTGTAGEGEAGITVLDFSAYNTALTITLDEKGLLITSGLNSLIQSSGRISAIYAGSGNDTFRLAANYSTALYGGAGDDTYILADGVVYDGLLDGGSGNDKLDYSAYSTDRNIVLTGKGSVDGFQGRENSLKAGFTNIEQVLGGKARDTLTGCDAEARFILADSASYLSEGRTLSFSGFEILRGGSVSDTFEIHGEQEFLLYGGGGDDTFVFFDNARLKGELDGEAGSNTLDYSDYTTARNFTMTGPGRLAGFNGKEASILGQFANISCLIGSQAIDALAGLDGAAVWEIGHGHGSYLSGGRTLNFAGIDTLIGGALDDSFVFQDGATLAGNIDGRSGNDTLDYSAYSQNITVNLSQGYATAVAGGISSIENVTGGSGDDELIGDHNDNILDGGAGNDRISGGAGNDVLYGGAGDDWLDGGAGDDVLYSGSGFNTLIGGDGNDTAVVAYQSRYQAPAGDIENWEFLTPPPEPEDSSGDDAGPAAPVRELGSWEVIRDSGRVITYLGLVIEIPPAVLPADAVFTVKELSQKEIEALIPAGLQVKIASKLYEITTSGDREFGPDNFITIKVPFDPDQISEGERPVLHYYDPEQDKWVSIATAIEYDEESGQWYAVASVNHLTLFAVISTGDLVLRMTIGERQLIIDGKSYMLDVTPVVDANAGRTLAPVRSISEALGAKVEWLGGYRQVVITKDRQKVVMTIGSREVLVNNERKTIDCAPQLLPSGRTIAPLRFVGEALGATVDYESSTRQISITTLAPVEW